MFVRSKRGALDPLTKPRRDAVIQKVIQHRDWSFVSIVIEKNHLNPVLYDPNDFYPKFLKMLLRFVLKGRVRPLTQQVLIYTDTLPMGSKKESLAVNVAIKSECKKYLNGVPFHVMHHSGDSNHWIQVADYCSWAINRKWEFQETEAYDLLRSRLVVPELALTDKGDGTTYY